jgi:hypothetical protein
MPIINGQPLRISVRCCQFIKQQNVIGLLVSFWLIDVSDHAVPDIIALAILPPQIADKEDKEFLVENRVATLNSNCCVKMCNRIKLHGVQKKYSLQQCLDKTNEHHNSVNECWIQATHKPPRHWITGVVDHS